MGIAPYEVARGACEGVSAPTVRDVAPQGHLFRCAPLQDAVPYGRFSTAYRVYVEEG